MNEPFVLELTTQHKLLEFPAAFPRYGYTYRIAVWINEQPFVFEPDEEGNYRVLGAPSGVQPDVGLLQAIVEKLTTLS